MPEVVLETERLILRTIGEGEAELHNHALNTPAVMEHLGGVKEPHEIEAKHAKNMALHAREGFSFLFGIEKATGELVAQVGIKRIDLEGAPNLGDHEVGWLIRQDRWRMGYAMEAMRGVLEWGFGGRVGAPHVAAITNPTNVGSWKLMEKLGMERREDLDFVSPNTGIDQGAIIQYSLTKAQWEQTQ